MRTPPKSEARQAVERTVAILRVDDASSLGSSGARGTASAYRAAAAYELATAAAAVGYHPPQVQILL